MKKFGSWWKYVLSVLGAAYVGLLVQVIVTTPLRFAGNDMLTDVVSSICCVAGSMVLLFFATKKVGYDENKTAESKPNRFNYVQMGIAIAVYIVFTLILGYKTGAATNVVIMARLFVHESALTDLPTMVREYPGAMFGSLMMQTVPLILPMIGGYRVGVQKRQKSRKALHGER